MSIAAMSPELETQLLLELLRLLDKSLAMLATDRTAVVSPEFRALDTARGDLAELLGETHTGENS